MKSRAPLPTIATGQTDETPRPARIAIDVPVSFTLEAEILADADTGQFDLVITTDTVTYQAARDRLTRLDALADQYEAITEVPTPCYPWCDHPVMLGTVHESTVAELAAPAGMDREDPLLAVALYADDDLIEAGPHFSVSCGSDLVFLDDDVADQFIAGLEKLTAHAKTLRARMTEERAA